MHARRLTLTTLRDARATLPAYDPAAVDCGIIHLGVGAFHRAHQAVYVDDCLSAGEKGWGIVGASLRSPDTRDAVAPQDGLYTLEVQDGSDRRLRIIGALRRMLVGPENPRALVASMADPAIRIVTLTVTEKAYLRNASGGLDLSHPDILHDLAHPAKPRTVHGFLFAALKARRLDGTPPFTVLCCDNLPANGATMRRLMLAFTRAADPGLSDFIEAVAFPSTMVDRIVPATTEEDRKRISGALGLADAWPVKAEPFIQWVIEDDFPVGRPGWERFGVTMVRDVRPYEDMKLRLLNGAHSTIAYLGLLLGHGSVSQAFADPAIRQVVDALWSEAIPTLPTGAGLNPAGYTAALAERFSNPGLVHLTAQIANDRSQKLPQRILAPARAQLEAGRPARHLALSVAAWIAACAARGRTLPRDHFSDPLDEKLFALWGTEQPSEETTRSVFAAAGFDAALGGQAALLSAAVAAHLDRLREQDASIVLKGIEA